MRGIVAVLGPRTLLLCGGLTNTDRAGGDIGLDLPRWLEELGFENRSLRPIIDVIPASDFLWQWPKAFIDVGLRRLVELGRMDAQRAKVVTEGFAAAEAAPGTLMVTPAVLEIIAVRR